MTMITGSVGRKGANKPDDVRTVQSLLNKKRPAPLKPVSVDGVSGKETESAIEELQRRVVKLYWPDGRVDPLGRTWKALSEASPTASTKPAAPASGASTSSTGTSGNLSGASWWRANQAKFPNSRSVEDLEGGFKLKVKAFLAALSDAGANVSIASTLRNKHRAYLMHYCFKVAKGQIEPSKVPVDDAVDIAWDQATTPPPARPLRRWSISSTSRMSRRSTPGTSPVRRLTWTSRGPAA
ncbi:MAG: peptidoglycan-binding domain-containing protein [Polyangiaceae bacterium]